MITVGPVALYLLIMMTHSDAGCLTMLTLNHKMKLVVESKVIPLVCSVNVGVNDECGYQGFFSFFLLCCMLRSKASVQNENVV